MSSTTKHANLQLSRSCTVPMHIGQNICINTTLADIKQLQTINNIDQGA